jgi:hypothetical protein
MMMATTETKDEMTPTLEFLQGARYLSFYCTVCEGEYDITEAHRMRGHPDYCVLSESEPKAAPTVLNIGCPECGHPYPEVLIGV